LTDNDQILAAEPVFHSHPPRRGGSEVSAVRRVPDYRPKLLEQQPENGLTLAFGPAQSLGVVMEDHAGGAAFEAAPGAVHAELLFQPQPDRLEPDFRRIGGPRFFAAASPPRGALPLLLYYWLFTHVNTPSIIGVSTTLPAKSVS